ncbi:MAG: hypothetical protein R3175_17215 [Marinobacter sp.]|uniref:hypothetical protein n=1 Tax=Marinobacter sp. TaxID=50741 RepID=UPI00299D2E0F|nr:hypothetical protein [Marinobacter sp.]MDX1757800.1 hypothetical protein [Marinobacter sp.]
MMTAKSWPLVVALLLTLGGHGVASAQEVAGTLEGAIFEGVLREAGATSGGDVDRLIFRDGRFISEACKEYGFEPAAYSVSQELGGVTFQATSVSPSHGTMVWRGSRNGDRMEAEVVWTKERWYWDIRREYRFEGQLAK